VPLTTVRLVTTGHLDDVADTHGDGTNASEAGVGLGKLETSSDALALLVLGRIEVRLALFSWFHALNHLTPSHNLFGIGCDTGPSLRGFTGYRALDV